MRCKNTFSEPGTLTTGNTVFGSEVRYRLNSVYDPSYAVGGRSVHNYSTMAGIYQQYRVDKCHYQIIFTTPGSANDIQCACTVASNTSGSLGGAASYFPAGMPEDPTESSLRRESVVAFCRERSTWRRCAA